MNLNIRSKGKSVCLDARTVLGKGGEARVFTVVGKPDLAAKIYHKPTQKRARKLEIMIANPPGDPMAGQGHISIAWPVDLLETMDPNPKVVGFLMPRVAGMSSVLNFYNPQLRHQKCPLFTYRYLHRTARNLAAVVCALHNRNYVIGDLNESNILVSDASLVTIVDTDSFQVIDPGTGDIHRCPVGKPEYTPPELQGVTFSKSDRITQSDLFGLGVLIFQLLMEGFHPFTGIYKGIGDPPAIEDRIASGHFPYCHRWFRPYDPSPLSPDLNILHGEVKNLFMRCFEEGHKNPQRRPNAQEWIEALSKSEASLIACSKNTQHLYGGHLGSCPWCERTSALMGRDPFPSWQAVRAGLQNSKRAKKPKVASPIVRSQSRPLASVSRSSGPPVLTRGLKQGLLALGLFFAGAWCLTRIGPALTRSTAADPSEKAALPVEPPRPEWIAPQTDEIPQEEPVGAPSPFRNLLNRFQALDNPALSARDRLRLYPQFLEDFRDRPEADEYREYARNQWERLSFEQVTRAYQDFLSAPSQKTAAALKNGSDAYLKHHVKRQSAATHTQRFARWHLSNIPHRLKVIIDQGNKFYVRILHNGAVFAETKGLGNFASVTLPAYRLSDTVILMGFQDDRFEDTQLDHALTINGYAGNQNQTLTDKRGSIHIQIVFDDFPGNPPL
ncbi:MAG: protein kinase [bacterium]|nr:protein kinase [bacterium]